MKAIVFFEDGHTEKVLYHTYTKDVEEKNECLDISFKFKTESGLYLYTEYLNFIPALYNPYDDLPPNFNWFHRKMWKLFFGLEIENVKEN